MEAASSRSLYDDEADDDVVVGVVGDAGTITDVDDADDEGDGDGRRNRRHGGGREGIAAALLVAVAVAMATAFGSTRSTQRSLDNGRLGNLSVTVGGGHGDEVSSRPLERFSIKRCTLCCSK